MCYYGQYRRHQVFGGNVRSKMRLTSKIFYGSHCLPVGNSLNGTMPLTSKSFSGLGNNLSDKMSLTSMSLSDDTSGSFTLSFSASFCYTGFGGVAPPPKTDRKEKRYVRTQIQKSVDLYIVDRRNRNQRKWGRGLHARLPQSPHLWLLWRDFLCLPRWCLHWYSLCQRRKDANSDFE